MTRESGGGDDRDEGGGEHGAQTVMPTRHL